jgi:hypothetical protein
MGNIVSNGLSDDRWYRHNLPVEVSLKTSWNLSRGMDS